jgi:hypothetical protein
MLFFYFAIPALLFEIQTLFRMKAFIAIGKAMKGKKSDEMTDKQKALNVCLFFYVLWVALGLFTSQWLLFGLFLILSLIPKKGVYVLCMMDTIISIALLLFIVINRFHLHYTATDLLNLIFN